MKRNNYKWKLVVLTMFSIGLFTLTFISVGDCYGGIKGDNPSISNINDPAYHRLDRIRERIIAWQDSFPNLVKVDTIGYSQQDNLPIWSVLISDNVDDDSRIKPAVVYIGQLHAEEVLGVEFSMWLIEWLLGSGSEMRRIRRDVDTYILPTIVPEGHEVVFTKNNMYRKNKRDNIGDGIFRYFPGWGADTSGVDLNRNFPLWWIHGDLFLQRGGNELYDYYRGPAPASESETRAIIKFFDKIRPYYSITLHSSRTGNVAEKVIYPWGFGQDTKFSPDIDAFNDLAYNVARRCKKYKDIRRYEPNLIRLQRGDSEVFYYYHFGTYAMRVEIGARGNAMQPDSAGIYEVIDDVADGLIYVLRSAAGIDNDRQGDIRTSRIGIIVRDRDTNEPVGNARLVMKNWATNMIPQRFSHPERGHYFWMVMDNFSDTLRVSKFGYHPWELRVNAGRTPGTMNVLLKPADWYTVKLDIVNSNGQALETHSEIIIKHPDSTWTENVYSGRLEIPLPEGEYQFLVYSGDDYVPRSFDLQVASDTSWTLALSAAIPMFTQSFDQADVMYTSDLTIRPNVVDSLRRWSLADDLYRTPPRSLTDSKRGNTPRGSDTWCAPYNVLDQGFDFSNIQQASLIYWLNQALEPDYDSMWVEVSIGGAEGTDPSTWDWVQVSPAHQDIAILNWIENSDYDSHPMQEYINRPWNAPPINLMKFNKWERFIVSLDDFIGEPVVHFRFRLRTDDYDEEAGVYLDDIQLLVSGEVPPHVQSKPLIPLEFSVEDPFPNPFNNQFNIRVNLPQASEVKVSLYDVRGRLNAISVNGHFVAGSHPLSVDLTTLSSGVYFVKVEAVGKSQIRKVTMIK